MTPNVRYVGTYWKARKEELPEDATMCVFHIKGRKADRIQFGGYSSTFGFWDKNDSHWYIKSKVDYWMPIPILPEKEKSK